MSLPAVFTRRAGLVPVLLLALALRLAWALAVPVMPLSDSSMYDIFAREIAAGRGYVYPDGSVTAYWPVGAPALYGLFYSLFGTNGWSVVGVNLVTGVALVAVIHRLAAIRFGDVVALFAGLIAAVWPLLIQFTTVLSSELPFLLLLTSAVLVREVGRDRPLASAAVAAALLVGSAYMRPTSLPLILILPLLDLFRHRKPLRCLSEATVALAVAAVLLAPWAARNQERLGAPALVSTNFGANLWMGNNPDSTGAYMELPKEDFGGEVRRDKLLKERALEYIADNPVGYLELSARRVLHSFKAETIGVVWNGKALPDAIEMPLKAFSSLFWLIAFALSLVGAALFLHARPIRIFDPLIVCPAMFAAVAILIVGQDRYHMPLIPFVAIFSAEAVRRIAARRSPAATVATEALAR